MPVLCLCSIWRLGIPSETSLCWERQHRSILKWGFVSHHSRGKRPPGKSRSPAELHGCPQQEGQQSGTGTRRPPVPRWEALGGISTACESSTSSTIQPWPAETAPGVCRGCGAGGQELGSFPSDRMRGNVPHPHPHVPQTRTVLILQGKKHHPQSKAKGNAFPW